MENNSFEKEVRRMMAELHLEPSEKIWPEIESQIQRKNRPTPVIFLISLLLLLLTAAGYLILNQNFPPAAERITTPQISQNFSKPDNAHGTNSFSRREKDSASNKINQYSGEKSLENTPESLKKQAIADSEYLKENHHSTPASSGPKEENIMRENLPHRTATDEITKSRKDKPGKVDLLPAKNIQKSFLYAKLDTDIEVHNISLPRNVKTSAIDGNWDFSIAVTGGSAWLFNSFLNPDHPSDPPPLNSPDPNPNPEPDPGPPVEPGTGSPPQQPVPTFAFSAQVMMKKSLSTRTRISLEPGYRQWSMQQYTGQKIHSPEGDYYLSHPDGANLHTGKMHFLELPVSLETQLNKGPSPLLFWHGGIHISRLLGTSVLQFDSERAHYIKDHSSFSPWQAGLNTGLDILIFSRRNIPIKIGPYFYYNFSKISKEGLYEGKHLSSASLKIEFLLSKK